MPDLGDGGGRPELGTTPIPVRPPEQDPSPAAARCEGGLSVLFSVLLQPGSQGRRSSGSAPFVQDTLAALTADPGAPVGLRLAVREHRDRPIHPGPAVAVTMLESWVPFAQDPELCRLDHLGPP